MAMLMLFQGSKHDENRVKMAGGPRGANCTPQPAPSAPREIRPEVDASAEFSAGLHQQKANGANLLHGSDLSHNPELDHPKPKAKRTKPSRLPLGYLGGLNARRPHGPDLGHLQIRRPLKLKSWVNAGAAPPQTGAQKILVANGRGVTQALTAGKPVDRIRLNDISTEVRFTHIGAGNFSCASGKAGNLALGDFLNLRGCALKRHTPRPAKVLHTPTREVVKRGPLCRPTSAVSNGSTVVEITMVDMPEIFPACSRPAEFSADVRALLAPKECRP